MFAAFKIKTKRDPILFNTNGGGRIIRHGPLEGATLVTFENSQKNLAGNVKRHQ